jgi:hypothetical protein
MTADKLATLPQGRSENKPETFPVYTQEQAAKKLGIRRALPRIGDGDRKSTYRASSQRWEKAD